MQSIIRRITITAIVMLAAAGFAPRAEAATIQIGSFQSASGDYAYVAGTLSGTTSGTFSFDPDFGLASGTYMNATLTVNSTRTADIQSVVTPTGTTLFQEMGGTIVIRDGSNNILLSATFSDAFLIGNQGALTVRLAGDTSQTATIVYGSSVFDASQIGPPSAFTFELNPITPALAINGTNFRDFAGPDTANFSATRVETPEPASLALFGLGLTTMAAVARRRRRAR